MPFGLSGGELGMLGLQGLGGMFQGAASAGSSKDQRIQNARNALNQVLTQKLGLAGAKMDRSREDAATFANAQGPLGDEQRYVQRNNILRAILPQLGNTQFAGPRDPGVAALTPSVGNPLSGLMQGGQLRPDIAASFSDNATSRALTDRRKALQALNPDYVFQPLTDYGLLQDADAFNAEVNQMREQSAGHRTNAYNSIEAILGEMEGNARSDLKAAEKSGGFWDSFKKILGPLAGIGASFIPGVGPWLAPLIGGGVGGATNGVQGAILGGLGGFGGEFAQGAFGGSRFGLGTPRGAQVYPQAAGPSLEQLGAIQPGFEGNIAGMLPGGALPGASAMDRLGMIPLNPGGMRPQSPGSPSQAILSRGRIPVPNTGFGGSQASAASPSGISPQDLALAGGGGRAPLPTPPGLGQPGQIPAPLHAYFQEEQPETMGGTPMPPFGRGLQALGQLGRQVMPKLPPARPPAGLLPPPQGQLGAPRPPAGLLPSGENNMRVEAIRERLQTLMNDKTPSGQMALKDLLQELMLRTGMARKM